MYILSPSILASDFGHLADNIKRAADAGSRYIHIDVMDGMFVPTISFGIPLMQSVRRVTDAVFDVHLMIEQPERYIDVFADAGADVITVHAESTKHLDRVIGMIHDRGLKAGVALNPATPLCMIEHVLYSADMILIMTVNPGFGGQKYIPATTQKIRDTKALLEKYGSNADIEVDGGINLDTIRTVLDAGANVLVAGSAVYKEDKIEENVEGLLNILKEYGDI